MHLAQVVGECCLEAQSLAMAGVVEAKHCGVECRAGYRLRPPRPPVEGIAEDRKAPACQVHADLVRATALGKVGFYFASSFKY